MATDKEDYATVLTIVTMIVTAASMGLFLTDLTFVLPISVGTGILAGVIYSEAF